MNQTVEGYGLGWLPDLPDHRDFTPHEEEPAQGAAQSVSTLLQRIGADKTRDEGTLPTSVDLRDAFSPIEDQGQLGSCTANAGAGVIEYFERQSGGKYVDVSRLFLYKATRNIMGVTGDTGAFLRTTMQALASFGAPPETYWPYDIVSFDDEPSAFCYAFGQDFKAIQYYRLDPPGTDRSELLNRIKTNLAVKLPAMFGFTVYASYTQADSTGAIPFPAPHEGKVGGHAVVVAGFDDNKKIRNVNPGGQETTGAFILRNSWGTSWGENGYGWLPYDYVTEGLATDWWSVIKSRWIELGQFGE
jgi:C1A family cysteine protease